MSEHQDFVGNISKIDVQCEGVSLERIQGVKPIAVAKEKQGRRKLTSFEKRYVKERRAKTRGLMGVTCSGVGKSQAQRVLQDEWYSLDYLIYSSHKTGTQTINHSLNLNGLKSVSCHYLPHIHLREGDLGTFAEHYFRETGRKLQLISVFREPVERHISSFFQAYGSRPLRLKEVRDQRDTLIFQYEVEELRQKFIHELKQETLFCYRESLHDICSQLNIAIHRLNFQEQALFSTTEFEHMTLTLMRFDLFFQQPKATLSKLTGAQLRLENANMAEMKWYADKYTAFKSGLEIPRDTLVELYDRKQDLISLFYSEGVDARLQQSVVRYGGNRSMS
ncbi:putative capsular polysaccharide synthesis family protein [Kiritimatiellota bacterium B12222]|nr:putative capsular polysaccharide synthesis family protein [Kiritimatiellota bacterium B12222]